MSAKRFYIVIFPRGAIVERFLRPAEAESYTHTFNRVMRGVGVWAERRRESPARGSRDREEHPAR